MDEATECIYRGARDLAGKRVGVLGLARTGAACVTFLAGQGVDVIALDSKPLDDLSDDAREAANQASTLAAPHGELAEYLPMDMLIVSPGVPTHAPFVEAARQAGAEVIGEVELAYRFFDAPMVAVTGTCGKGTTVTTLGSFLEAAGRPHVVAGNIGTPLIGQVSASSELDVVVAEISSFQLETTVHFHPHIAALLNISEDHLERYRDLDAYIDAKALIFRNQTENDWAIFCKDDPVVGALTGRTRARCLTVALNDPAANGRLEGDQLVIQLPGRGPEIFAERSNMPLPGDHHIINTLVSALAARLCGAPVSVMRGALAHYRPAPHLMTLVAEHAGVRYIDDSKATNPASAVADLSSIQGPAIVIAGGKEKDTDFTEFGKALNERARLVLLMGECAPRIAQSVGNPQICRDVASMQEAVRLAVAEAQPGDTVALCPGCSSLDMFANQAARGDIFAECVKHELAVL